MPVEVAASDVIVPHHARMHVAGQVAFRGRAAAASIVVQDVAGTGHDLEITSAVAESATDRYLVQIAGDTRRTLGPGVYRVRLLVERACDVVLADLRHVLLGATGG